MRTADVSACGRRSAEFLDLQTDSGSVVHKKLWTQILLPGRHFILNNCWDTLKAMITQWFLQLLHLAWTGLLVHALLTVVFPAKMSERIKRNCMRWSSRGHIHCGHGWTVDPTLHNCCLCRCRYFIKIHGWMWTQNFRISTSLLTTVTLHNVLCVVRVVDCMCCRMW